MKIIGMFENTEDVELTLEITMTIKEWKNLKGDISNNSFFLLEQAINDAVSKAQCEICQEIKRP